MWINFRGIFVWYVEVPFFRMMCWCMSRKVIVHRNHIKFCFPLSDNLDSNCGRDRSKLSFLIPGEVLFWGSEVYIRVTTRLKQTYHISFCQHSVPYYESSCRIGSVVGYLLEWVLIISTHTYTYCENRSYRVIWRFRSDLLFDDFFGVW